MSNHTDSNLVFRTVDVVTNVHTHTHTTHTHTNTTHTHKHNTHTHKHTHML
jgi:hypothetical protein